MVKKERYKVKPFTEGKKNIIAGLIQEYRIESAQDIQEALKDLLGGIIQNMMEAEMNEHLGYESHERSDSENARNGKKKHFSQHEILKIGTQWQGVNSNVRKSYYELVYWCLLEKILLIVYCIIWKKY